MLESQLVEKVRKLLALDFEIIAKDLEELVGRLAKNGSVDLENCDNDYSLPKCFVSALYSVYSESWRPLGSDLRKKTKAINYCIK